jgi:hypothetical protein
MARVEIFQPKTDLYAQKLAMVKTKELVTIVVREAKMITLRYTGNSYPAPTGELSRSIHGNVGRKGRYLVVGSVGSNDKKAMVVHDGAKPHWMRPRLAGGMKFYWKAKGRFVCIKVPILHVGMNGKFYLVEPLKIEGRRLGWRVVTSAVTERLLR